MHGIRSQHDGLMREACAPDRARQSVDIPTVMFFFSSMTMDTQNTTQTRRAAGATVLG